MFHRGGRAPLLEKATFKIAQLSRILERDAAERRDREEDRPSPVVAQRRQQWGRYRRVRYAEVSREQLNVR